MHIKTHRAYWDFINLKTGHRRQSGSRIGAETLDSAGYSWWPNLLHSTFTDYVCPRTRDRTTIQRRYDAYWYIARCGRSPSAKAIWIVYIFVFIFVYDTNIYIIWIDKILLNILFLHFTPSILSLSSSLFYLFFILLFFIFYFLLSFLNSL